MKTLDFVMRMIFLGIKYIVALVLVVLIGVAICLVVGGLAYSVVWCIVRLLGL